MSANEEWNNMHSESMIKNDQSTQLDIKMMHSDSNSAEFHLVDHERHQDARLSEAGQSSPLFNMY